MAKNDLSKRLDDIIARRTKLENELEKQQAALRKLDRQDPESYQPQLGKVNATKAEIARISNEHVELARAIALVSGGTNHAPSPLA